MGRGCRVTLTCWRMISQAYVVKRDTGWCKSCKKTESIFHREVVSLDNKIYSFESWKIHGVNLHPGAWLVSWGTQPTILPDPAFCWPNCGPHGHLAYLSPVLAACWHRVPEMTAGAASHPMTPWMHRTCSPTAFVSWFRGSAASAAPCPQCAASVSCPRAACENAGERLRVGLWGSGNWARFVLVWFGQPFESNCRQINNISILNKLFVCNLLIY